MKRILFISLIFFFFLLQNAHSKDYALIIGINDYEGIWLPLKNAVNDCKALSKILIDKYGFEDVSCLYNKDATRDNILAKLHEFKSILSNEDNILIYFAGHGFMDEVNEGYWVPSELSNMKTFKCVSNYDIKNVIAKLQTKHTLVIADACFSGTILTRAKPVNTIDNEFHNNMDLKVSRQAISSGGIQEVVDGGRNNHSVFAHYLIKILTENDKKFIAAHEIAYYLMKTVPTNTPNKQQPDFGPIGMGDEGGSFIFFNANAVTEQIVLKNYDTSSVNRNNQLKVGVVNFKGEDAINETFYPFTEYIAKKYRKEPYLEVVDYEHLSQRLHNGDFDIGIFSPFTYVEAKNIYPELEVFGIHKAKGRIGYYGVILVRKESGIKSLHELKGKSFLFAHSKSTSGYQYPIMYFREAGIEPDNNFFNYEFSGSHRKSIEALSKGTVDGIATYLEALDDYGANIDISEFEIIYKSQMIPYNAYVFSPKLDVESRVFLSSIIFNAHNYPENKKMFENRLKIESWQRCSDNYYNSVRDYLIIKRNKKAINFSISTNNSNISDEIISIDLLREIINFDILNTNRFSLKNEQNSGIVDLDLSLTFDNEYVYYTINIDSQPIRRGKILLTNLEAEAPVLVCNALLKNMIIETIMDYDGNVAFVPFGIDDGINENYSYMIYNEESGYYDIVKPNDVFIRQPNTTFDKKYSSQDKGQKVKIIFNGG